MAAIKPAKMRGILTGKLGFTEDTGKHWFYVLELDGRVCARTAVSHSKKKDIRRPLLGAMATQMSVGYRELLDMVACNKSAAWYHAKLRDSQ